MRAPAPTYLQDYYRFSWAEEGLQIDVTRLDEGRSGLTCELTVSFGRELLRQGNFNLSAPNTRSAWKKALEERMPDVDWYNALEAICHLSLKHWRDGEPAIDLRSVDPYSRPRFLYAPYIEHGGPTIFFADGGSGKSMFALALAVSVSTGVPLLGGVVADVPAQPLPVLYLDWETDAGTHAARLRAICAAAEIPIPPVFYQRMSSSLYEGAATVRRRLGELGAGFVVVDSIGPARDGVAADGSSETIKLHSAARSFGVPWAGIDHIAKGKESDKTKPFGSVYQHNLARITWAIEKASDSGPGKFTIALVNHKSNNGRTSPRRGYDVFVQEDDDGWPLTIRYEGVDMRDVPSFTKRLSQRDQLVSVLKNGALTDTEIVAALATVGVTMNDATVRAVASRYKDLFTRIHDRANRGAPRLGLLEKAHVDA